MSKLWSGRFSEQTDALVDEFNASITFDKKLAAYDIKGSQAHLKMLERQGIVTQQEATLIADGLARVAAEIADGTMEMKLK